MVFENCLETDFLNPKTSYSQHRVVILFLNFPAERFRYLICNIFCSRFSPFYFSEIFFIPGYKIIVFIIRHGYLKIPMRWWNKIYFVKYWIYMQICILNLR